MALGIVKYLKNPFTGNFVFPVTRTKAVYNDDGSRLDKYLEALKSLPGNNLLINSNFANPINQRGYVSGRAVSSFEFVLDRWLLQFSGTATQTNLKMNNGYVTIKGFAGTKYNDLFQKIEFPESYAGKTLTLSAKYRCTSGSKAMLYVYNGGNTTDVNSYPSVELICDGDWHTDYVTFTVKDDVRFLTASISPGRFEWDGSVHKWEELAVDTELDVEWMKLELGESPTPYVPRLYGEELQLCKRYYKEITGFKSGTVYTANDITFIFDDIRDMRTAPSPSFKNSTFDGGGVYIAQSLNSSYVDGFAFSLGVASQSNTVRCTATKTSHGLTANSSAIVVPLANPICLDAEL